MPFGTYVEQKTLDLFLGAVALAAPATVYVGLSTTAVSNAAAPTEPSGSGYTRVAVANTLANFPAASGNTPATKSNGAAITFPAATGGAASWGTVVHFFIADAASGGNVLFFAPLTVAQTIGGGDTVSFGPGALALQLS